MKTWTLRFRVVDKGNFERLRKGVKAVETRAATVKYLPMEIGDKIVFVCGRERFSKIIKKKSHFKSIDSLFTKISFKKIMPDMPDKKSAKQKYYSYPDYEQKIKEFGILALELK